MTPAGADAGPATTLLLAVWVGLVSGFLDLGLMVVKTRLSGEGFYRLGDHYSWVIPAGDAALVVLPGAGLALAARLRRAPVPFGLVVGGLAFVGFLTLTAALPVAVWASLLLSAGLAYQCARRVGPRHRGFLRVVRLTAPVLVAALAAVAIGTSAARAWSERRATAALGPPPPAAKNVLLIVWDTVRAGNLSLYGYSRPTTPNLERFARRGVRFDHAFATSSWTLPSHASMFTGRWPHETSAGWRSPLDGRHRTLAEHLSARGYDTAGFVANLDFCGRETGLARGFAHYEDHPVELADAFTRYTALGRKTDLLSVACAINLFLEKYGRGASVPTPRAKEHAKRGADIDRSFLDWLSRRRGRDRPFFAFLNYVDAHTPYEVPDPSAPGFGLRPTSWQDVLTLANWNSLDKARLNYRNVRMAADLYDDNIAFLDRRLGLLLAELGRLGVLDDTLVIVTSDHGEHIGDHLLFFHGCSLYRQLVEVPLVIVGAGAAPPGRVVSEPVSLRDLPSTVAGLLDPGASGPFPGRSLARFWAVDDAPHSTPAEPLLMETGKPPHLTNQGREPAARGPMKSLVAWGMHYILAGDGQEELYILNADPEERVNVAGWPHGREALQRFRNTLAAMLKRR